MTESQLMKCGQILRVDSGQWSEYGVVGYFRVLRDFDPVELLKDFPENPSHDYDTVTRWLGYLSGLKLIEDVNGFDRVWHLDEYRIDPEDFRV